MSAPAPLFRATLYLRQFERLRKKARARHGNREPETQGLGLSALEGQAPGLCERLARDVQSGQFTFSPLTRVETFAQGKRRIIHRADLVDALVLGVLAQRLTQLFEPVLGESVYAYRPGRSPQHAIHGVQSYLAEHHRAKPTRERGVFVVQRDLAAYGESIPTHSRSKLWPLLDRVIGDMPDQSEARVLHDLVHAACRPAVKLPSGPLFTLEHGLPTGSPIQQPLANLYLSPLDETVKTGFYARFGDDLLLLDECVERSRLAAENLQRVCTELELKFNPQKTKNLYFTTPGRPFAGGSDSGFAAASHVEYLGARLSFDGRLGLKRKHLRELLLRTRQRVANVVALSPPEHAREQVAQAVANALFQDSSLAEALSAPLQSWVDDRVQLRQLDRLLAQLCAEALSTQRGVRALRHTPPRALRAAGLPSLLELRRRHARYA